MLLTKKQNIKTKITFNNCITFVKNKSLFSYYIFPVYLDSYSVLIKGVWEYKLKTIEFVHTLPKRGIYYDMFQNIIKMIGDRAFFQATGCEKMIYFVLIIHEKKNIIM